MDADNVIVVARNDVSSETETYEEQRVKFDEAMYAEEDNVNLDDGSDIKGINGRFEGLLKLNNGSSGHDDDETMEHKEVDSGEKKESEYSTLKRDASNAKNVKPLDQKSAAGKREKKTGDRNNTQKTAVSSVSATVDSRPKQPFALRTKNTQVIDRHISDSKAKPAPMQIKVNVTKARPRLSQTPSEKTSAPSSRGNVSRLEGLVEKPEPKTDKSGSPDKAEGSIHSSSSSGTGDNKTRRLGNLPSYGFSFKCNERAEKRREYYSKLEEKIHAKEQEENNLQARTKENQEAELKNLRKSLKFKATPLPSFYQEPPPKAELKKLPTTRAKSPKFARKKDSPSRDSAESNSRSLQSSRLSMDERVSHGTPVKGVSPVTVKKPIRKSLPKLPSERTILSSEKIKLASRKATPTVEKATSTGETKKPVSPKTISSKNCDESASCVHDEAEPEADAEPSQNQQLPSHAPEVEEH